MLELEHRPVRPTWMVCGAFALPLLLVGIVAQAAGSAAADVFTGIVFWLLAFALTVTIAVRTRLTWGQAVVVAPILFLAIVFAGGILLVNLGIVRP